VFAGSAIVLSVLPFVGGQRDDPLVPPHLGQEQKENLRKFLDQQSKSELDKFLPSKARITDRSAGITDADRKLIAPKDTPIRLYPVMINKLRPVPGSPDPNQVVVYIYRYHPEVGRQGVTVKYVVNLSNGEAEGDPELLTGFPTPLVKEEEREAIALAREKSAAVKALYEAAGDKVPINTEILSPTLLRASDGHSPGDRIASIRFIAGRGKDAKTASVWANLTRRVVTNPPGGDR
jgi:hypothetical protein